MREWMSNLTLKLERYKPAGSGYNRMHSIRLSKSVTQMLNNPPIAAEHSSRGVLSRTESEWEEVYPTVKLSRQYSSESASSCDSDGKFTHYRNCSTRIT